MQKNCLTRSNIKKNIVKKRGKLTDCTMKES